MVSELAAVQIFSTSYQKFGRTNLMEKFTQNNPKSRSDRSRATISRRSMGISGVLWKTLGLFAILHFAALAGIFWAVEPALKSGHTYDPIASPWIVGLLGSFVAGGWLAIVAKRTASVLLIVCFAASEGLFLGGFSAYFEVVFPGFAIQTAFATLSAVIAALALFAVPRIRIAGRSAQFIFVALGAYFVFALHNVAVSGLEFLPDHIAWGRGSVTVLSVPLGLIFALHVVASMAYSLVLEFERIEYTPRPLKPSQHEWRAAFKVMATIFSHCIETPRALVSRK